jgi:hypothetical protein
VRVFPSSRPCSLLCSSCPVVLPPRSDAPRPGEQSWLLYAYPYLTIVAPAPQAESGKSTLRKQFQLKYASKALEKERPTWRPVVHSNIIKAVRTLVDALDAEFAPAPAPSSSASTSALPSPSSAGPSSPVSPHAEQEDEEDGEALDLAPHREHLLALRTRLLPLLALEDALSIELSGGASIGDASARNSTKTGGGSKSAYARPDWQALFSPWFAERTGASPAVASSAAAARGASGAGLGASAAEMAARQLAAVRKEVGALWASPAVGMLVRTRRVELDECAPL